MAEQRAPEPEGDRDGRDTEASSKLDLGEEEATATVRRLRGSYLEHRGMRVVDDGSAGGTIIAKDDDGELSFVDTATKCGALGLRVRSRFGAALLHIAHPCLISVGEVGRKF